MTDLSVLRHTLGLEPLVPVRSAPAAARSFPLRASLSSFPATRPDLGLQKALNETRELHAQSVLGGLRPGAGVFVGRSAVPFRVVDLDPASGRAHVREVRDTSADPIGVEIAGQSGWCEVASLTPAPEHDAPELADFGKALATSQVRRGAENKAADVRRRAADLVARTRAEAAEGVAAGRVSAQDAGEVEALLGRFANRMGL